MKVQRGLKAMMMDQCGFCWADVTDISDHPDTGGKSAAFDELVQSVTCTPVLSCITQTVSNSAQKALMRYATRMSFMLTGMT